MIIHFDEMQVNRDKGDYIPSDDELAELYEDVIKEDKMSYSYKEVKDRLYELLVCTSNSKLLSGDHEAIRVGIFAIEKIEKILPWLDTDIDNELALERIREVVYSDLHTDNETRKENL